MAAGLQARAEDVIKYPTEELPSEVVLPNLSRPEAVIHPTVEFSKRMEVDLTLGSLLDDPYFDGTHFTGRAFYFIDPFWAVGMDVRNWIRKTSSYSEQFRNTGASGPD